MKHLGQLANSDAILRCHGILSQHDLAKLHVQTGRGPSGPRPGAGVLAGGWPCLPGLGRYGRQDIAGRRLGATRQTRRSAYFTNGSSLLKYAD